MTDRIQFSTYVQDVKVITKSKTYIVEIFFYIWVLLHLRKIKEQP